MVNLPLDSGDHFAASGNALTLASTTAFLGPPPFSPVNGGFCLPRAVLRKVVPASSVLFFFSTAASFPSPLLTDGPLRFFFYNRCRPCFFFRWLSVKVRILSSGCFVTIGPIASASFFLRVCLPVFDHRRSGSFGLLHAFARFSSIPVCSFSEPPF